MFEILPLSSDKVSRFDKFVLDESINGTFLQTNRFLSYHPKDRFKDASFILHKSGVIVAYFTGVVTEDGCWVSHKGTTFGGPIISRDYYSASRMMQIIETADCYLKTNFKSVRMKPTGHIFCTQPTDLLEYALEHFGYERRSELSCFTDLEGESDVLEICTSERRYDYRKACRCPISYHSLQTNKEFEDFYKHLLISKQKYHTKPVHTLEELHTLQNLFPDEVLFRGVFLPAEGEQMVCENFIKNNSAEEELAEIYLSGVMIFNFKQTKVWHLQYVAPNEDYHNMNATTVLNIEVLREAKANGIKKFSWGISTEDGGKILNENLYKFKESFGAKPCVNTCWTKHF
ncbi:MAG: GNAT family N-acetyltransferase [Fibrobacter sp.]|nr:GNAT family N-acetyltransferase [Fibrobacter sp.]